jgi:hypothetical protein
VARLTTALAAAFALAACAPGGQRAGDADAPVDGGLAPGARPDRPPASLLPYPAFGDWTLAGDVALIGAERLDELVGAEAAGYRRYGCVAAAVGDYRSARFTGATLRVEIFEMRSPLDAFGALAEQITASEDAAAIEPLGVLEIREAGIMSPGRVTFVDGRHLVNLVARGVPPTAEGSRDDTVEEQLPSLARRLSIALPGDSALPGELDVLPRERRVRRSERYDPEHLMGIEALGPGVSALYGDPGPRYRVGVLLGLDEPGAVRARDALAAMLDDRTDVAGLGDGAFRGAAPGLGTLVVAVRGSVVAVALFEPGRPLPDRGAAAATLDLALQPVATRPRPQDPRPWRRGEPAIGAPTEHDAGAASTGSRR